MILGLASPAFACLCVGGGEPDLEVTAATGPTAPRNAGVWIVSTADDDAFDERFELRADPPVDAGRRVDMSRVLAGRGAGFLGFEQPVPEGTVVSLIDLATGLVVADWTAGPDVDTEAPSWDGRYRVDASRSGGPDNSCGTMESQRYELLDVSDDHAGPAELLIHLASRRVGRDLWGWGDEMPRVGRVEACPSPLDDPTLEDHWRRSFDVEVFDLAGNVTTGHRVSTSGCASTTSSPGVLGVFVAAAACRRRHHAGARQLRPASPRR